MDNPSTSNESFPADRDSDNLINTGEPEQRNLTSLWNDIVHLGLGNTALRIGTGAASIILVLMVVWVMSNFYLSGPVNTPQSEAVAAALPTATPKLSLPVFESPEPAAIIYGITRLAQLHTTLPSRPRFEIVEYTVIEGDTLFTIAEQFGLKPATLLWGNPQTLPDPHLLRPGQVLNILPVDGVLYEWHEGDGLNGVSKYYGVTPDVIIDWPSNNLSKDTIGDYAMPNIEPGTMIFVPGGKAEFITWSMPTITRDNPAVAKTLGAGYCGVVYTGAVGTGTFVWPASTRYISGYTYDPEIGHYAIDIGGSIGIPIYAADNGVVVYSGWNDYGYGYLLVIDHGNGWQTYYAHLSTIYVGCGQSVYQGDTVALMGSTGNSTGPHLHFEMRSETYGRVNPLDFLQ
jgi:murein DD-endopeptidase MepM/ murein hydrolase activator NlpD